MTRDWTRAEVRKALNPYKVKVRFESHSYGTLIVVTTQRGLLVASTCFPGQAIRECEKQLATGTARA